MRYFYPLTFLVILGLVVSACIKEEAAYREADILAISLPTDTLLAANIINQKGNNRIIVTVYDTTGLRHATIRPNLQLSPGAQAQPASGEPIQLHNFQAKYLVTAQNQDQKEYSLYLVPDRELSYNFENWYQVSNSTGSRVYDMLSDPFWSNANPGVNIYFRDYEAFPTRKTTDCYSGKYGVVLETVEGQRNSTFILDIPLYAGSAFRGNFKFNLLNPINSAKFGQIHSKAAGKPVRFNGWYKYSSGAVYQTCTPMTKDGKKVNEIAFYPDRKDQLDIYAVLFKVPRGEAGQEVYLTAENVKTSVDIVASAILEDSGEKENWTRFSIPFTYTERIDYATYDYKLAIVLSSSTRGAFYEGSIGSILHVDEINVETEAFD